MGEELHQRRHNIVRAALPHLDEVVLRMQHGADALVDRWDLIDHVHIPAALEPLGWPVVEREAAAGIGAAQVRPTPWLALWKLPESPAPSTRKLFAPIEPGMIASSPDRANLPFAGDQRVLAEVHPFCT